MPVRAAARRGCFAGGGVCGGSEASARLRALAFVGTAIPSARTSESMRMRGLLLS
jgi:hypothetical protein